MDVIPTIGATMNPFDATTVEEWLTSFDRIVFLDVESFYSTDYSLSKMTTAQYINDDLFYLQSIAMTDIDGSIEYYDEHSLDAAIAEMQALTHDKETKWMMVAHNTKFDAAVLRWRYGIEADWYCCTMSLAAGIFTGASVSLKNVCEYLWAGDPDMQKGNELINFKGHRQLTQEQHKAMKGYNVQDVYLCANIFNALLPFYPLSELYQIHLSIRMYVLPSFVVNRPLMKQCIEEEIAETQTMEEAVLSQLRHLEPTLGFEMNRKAVSSNLKFEHVLIELGIEVPYKVSPKGNTIPAFGKKDVAWIALREGLPDFAWLFDYRERIKSTGSLTRAERFLASSKKPPHFISVPLRYYGAHTGRYSGEDKLNLQNLRRGSKHREALCAPEGYNIHICDLSNIEARIVAWLADQEDLLRAFAEGRDLYCEFAGEVVYEEPVTKADKTRRQVGKQCILGLGYSMGWRTFQNALLSGPMGAPPMPCDDDFAKKCVYGYRQRYPMIVMAWKYCDLLIQEMKHEDCDIHWKGMHITHEKIKLPNGMYLRYPSLQTRYEEDEYVGGEFKSVYWNGKFWKNLYGGLLFENISQALASVILKEQMERLDRWAQSHQLGQVCLQVHDEIIMCCKPNEQFSGQDIQNKMYEVMRDQRGWYADVPLDCEGVFGEHYNLDK